MYDLKMVIPFTVCYAVFGYSLRTGISWFYVYYVVSLDIPLRRDYQWLLCILCSFFGHSLNMGLSYFVHGLK